MDGTVKVNGPSSWDFIYKSYLDFIDNWFLMSSPLAAVTIVAAYLLFVLKIGPAYMKDRPAYNLRNVLHVYNAAQVSLSCYLVYICVRTMLRYGFYESQCLLQNREYAYMVASAGYAYTMAKLTELLDTVLFVLRKKWNQISFLHVYHHTMMFSMCWFALKYSPSYVFAFLATLNSFVHVVMYTYYGLSAFPGLAKYLWWKKYITKLQLVQFFIILVSVTVAFFTSKCPQSYFLVSFCWSQCFLFTYLFGKFYIENYKKNKKNVKNAAKDSAKLHESFVKLNNNYKMEEKSM